MCLGINVFGPHTRTLAPNSFRQRILLIATRECRISPTMAMFFPETSPCFSSKLKASSKACVGCSCVPSPALTTTVFTFFAKKLAAPGCGCRITTRSTFMARMLFTVSTRVSPLATEELFAEKFRTSALSRFSASSNDNRVRVEFSKNRFAMVKSRNEGTFLIGLLMTSLNPSAVLKMSSKSFRVNPRMPVRCLVDSWFMQVFRSIAKLDLIQVGRPNPRKHIACLNCRLTCQ